MRQYDVIVIGAGPAGAEAGIVAAALELNALVIDEAPDAGGQIYHPSSLTRPSSEGKGPEGDALRQRLKSSGVETAFDHRVWSIAKTDAGFEVGAVGPVNP